MRKHRLTENAAICLDCACHNPKNHAARELLHKTKSLSAIGVVAAIFVASSHEHEEVVSLARAAIREEREACDTHRPTRRKVCNRQKN